MGAYKVPPDLEQTFKDILTRLKALEVGRPRFYAEALTEVSTANTAPTDLGGPSITIDVPTNAFVVMYAQADVQALGGAGVTGAVYLTEPTDFPATSAKYAIMENQDAAYRTLGTATTMVAQSPPVVSTLTFPATQGQRTYKLMYSGSTGFPCYFKNRKFWMWTLD